MNVTNTNSPRGGQGASLAGPTVCAGHLFHSDPVAFNTGWCAHPLAITNSAAKNDARPRRLTSKEG
jgi:hypothetical protein